MKIVSTLPFLALMLAVQSPVSAAVSYLDEGSLETTLDNSATRLEIAKIELERVAGKFISQLSSKPNYSHFQELMSRPEMIYEVMFSGPLPEDMEKMMTILAEISAKDLSEMKNTKERSTAVAVAMVFASSSGWPTEKAWGRYEFYRDSRRKGLLHPSFDKLRTYEKRFVVNYGQNGSYSDGDEASMVWQRDSVKLPVEGYIEACWQAPYNLENLYGDSIHGDRYYMPFTSNPKAQIVRDVGGVCGSLSHYGANAARANGIPAGTMGEPGHCAYAVRIGANNWVPSYSLSSERSPHYSLITPKTWTNLILMEKLLQEKQAYEIATSHLHQARSLVETKPELAETAYRLALDAQPANIIIWREAIDFLINKRKPDLAAWGIINRYCCKSLSAYPEAAADVISRYQSKALEGLSAEQKIPFLLTFHEAIVDEAGPVMWKFEDMIAKQMEAFGGSQQDKLNLYKSILAVQAKSKHWFAPTIAAGEKIFKDPESNLAFFNAIAEAFSSDVASSNEEGLKKALCPAIISAEESNNLSAFQALGKASAKLFKPQKLSVDHFPGDLLSAGGMIKLSSTSHWDSPEGHWGLIEAQGGRFHTKGEKNPHVIVRLGKLGDLSGMVIQETSGGYNLQRVYPMKAYISEDGQNWTEVAEQKEALSSWKIDLHGKAPKVQYVKIEHIGEGVFHLNAVHVYGRKLQ